MPLVISTSVPATTLTEFVAWCKGKSLSYGSYSPGTTSHAFQQLFSDVNKLNMVHVPYRGEGPMVIDLLGDRVQCAMGTMSTLSPHIRSGRIRALASLSDTRIPSLPGVPTFLELGYPKAFGWTGFIGLFAPAELPKPVAEKLAGAFARVLAMPAVRDKLVSMDVVIQESLLGATGVQVAKTYSAWARLVVDLNLAASA